jgi:PBSX family phage portal protein
MSNRIRRIRSPRVSTRITAIGPSSVKRADTSRQILEVNEFVGLAGISTILLPPYDPLFLAQCVERSNMIKQCISAMVTNVALGGYDVGPVRVGVEIDPDEKEELLSFIESPNSEDSLTSIQAKVVEDYETYGYGFLEVIRDRKSRISLLRHCPAATLRLTTRDPEPQLVEFEVSRGKRVSVVHEYRTFRRFVQVVRGVPRYFREYGDLRTLDMHTGKFGKTDKVNEASEIIHFRQNSTDAYGVPRWINQLPSVLGSRESEECNLRYFEDNTVPPMMLTVAGGRLTSQSYRELTEMLNAQGVGKERQNKIMLVEAVPEREGLDDKGSVSLKLDKLTDARQGDGLFKEYDEGNQAKIRSSFRLPPVAVGLSQDVTFATANVSAFIAESQVYLPLRNTFDELYNKRIVNSDMGLNLRTVRLASRVPLITNSETLITSLTALNVMGAITPRMANEAANRTLQIDIPQYPDRDTEGWEEWMDKPIVFVTKGTASDAGQGLKDDSTKKVENGGTVAPVAPEHGQE